MVQVQNKKDFLPEQKINNITIARFVICFQWYLSFTIECYMMATAHLLVAGAIAAKVQQPILAPILAFSSHFLLDSIPHWDFGTNWRKRSKFATGAFAIGETVIGFILAFFIYHTKVSPIVLLISLFLSIVPDWIEAPWYIFFADPTRKGPKKDANFLERLFYGYYKCTNRMHTKGTFPAGLISQIVTVAFFVLLLR